MTEKRREGRRWRVVVVVVGGGDNERQSVKDERAVFTVLMNHFLLMRL